MRCRSGKAGEAGEAGEAGGNVLQATYNVTWMAILPLKNVPPCAGLSQSSIADDMV